MWAVVGIDIAASMKIACGVPPILFAIHSAHRYAPGILSGLGLFGSCSVVSTALPFGQRRLTFSRIELFSDCITSRIMVRRDQFLIRLALNACTGWVSRF